MLQVMVICALVYGVQLNEDSTHSSVVSVGHDEPSEIASENLAVLMDKRKTLESVRLAEVLTLRAIERTKAKSEELTKILNKRLFHMTHIFRRLPSIVAYLTKNYPDMEVGLTQMSYMYLTSLIGSGEPPAKSLASYFQKFFKKGVGEEKEADVIRMARRASKEMENLTQILGQNYLGSTMVPVAESVSFMERELNKTEAMLSSLPEIVDIVIRGPYDYISEDRLDEGYKQLIKSNQTE